MMHVPALEVVAEASQSPRLKNESIIGSGMQQRQLPVE